MFSAPPSPSSLLAIATTAHLALAALCNHRRAAGGGFSVWAVPSLALAATPWLLPSLTGLACGLGLQGLWFLVVELIAGWAPTRPAATARRPIGPAESSPTSRPRPARQASGISSPFVQTPVLAAFDESRDIKTIRLARPAGFEFEAGQFVTLRLQVDGREFARCYSISSAPHTRGYLEISVKRAGLVSNALHAIARPGAFVSIKSANGKFKYPSGDDRPILLLAGGVGITPLMSMLRHAIATEPARPVTLLYAAQTAADLAFRDELSGIARRHPQARVFCATTREPSPAPDLYPGRIDEALLRTTVPDLAHSISFICGPTPMIDELRAQLAAMGVPNNQIRYEVFAAAVAASTASEASEPRRRRPTGAVHDMSCTVSAKTVPIAAGQTVLEAAEASGIDVPSLCRAGVCGTCRTRVTSGGVECPSTTLSDDERREGYVLACVSTATSACSVEL